MSYLNGKLIEIETSVLKNMIGKKIKCLLHRDIDRSGRGYYFPRIYTIISVYGKYIEVDNGDMISFSNIIEMILLEDEIK